MVTWTQPPPHDGESEVCLSHSPHKFIHSPYNKILFTSKLCVQILMSSHCFLIHCLRIFSCREHLTQWGAALPGKTQLACFYRGCVWASIRCAAHTAKTCCYLACLADITVLSLTQRECFFFCHYPHEGETWGDSPSSSHCFCASW